MINVFTRQGCPQCERTKNLMKAKGIEFNVVDITDDEKMTEALKRTSPKEVWSLSEYHSSGSGT